MSETHFVVAGALIDGSGTDVRRNVFLAIKNNIITEIGPAANLHQSGGAEVVDMSHCVILPTLVDCSVYLSRSPSVDRRVRLSSEDSDPAKKATMLERHIGYCYAHGVHGVADGDNITDLVKAYQNGMTQGSIVNIRTSDSLSRNKQDSAASILAEGDFLKISYSANIDDDEPTTPHLSHENLCSLLQHRGGKKAVVLANGPQQVEEALEAGCDAIEQGFGMGEDNIRKMAKKDVLWIPSVLRAKNSLDGAGAGGDVCCRFSQQYVAPGKPVPGADIFWKKMLTEQLKQLQFARQLGVTTAIGTGAGSVGILHGESMVEEMKLFIKAGYSLVETVQCASENGANFFDMKNLGALAIGQDATFLIARGTVQQLPRKLSYLEGIYVDGLPSISYRKHPIRSPHRLTS